MNKYINESINKKHSKLRHMASHKPKDYWKFLNSLKRKPDSGSPDKQEFYSYFKSMCEDLHVQTDEITDEDEFSVPDLSENSCEILNKPFTQSDIDKCIRKLKNLKSPGLDCILNEYIKPKVDE